MVDYSSFLPIIGGSIIAVIAIAVMAREYKSKIYDIRAIPYYDVWVYNKNVFYTRFQAKVTEKSHTTLREKKIALMAPEYPDALQKHGSGIMVHYDLANAQAMAKKEQKEIMQEYHDEESWIGRLLNPEIRKKIDPTYYVESRIDPAYLEEFLEAHVASDIMKGAKEGYQWILPIAVVGIIVIGVIVILLLAHSWGLIGAIEQNVSVIQTGVQPYPTPGLVVR